MLANQLIAALDVYELFNGLFSTGPRRNRWNLFELLQGLFNGQAAPWIAVAVVAACITFFAVYKKVTGKSFVKSKRERREARHRRKHVLWEYRRDR